MKSLYSANNKARVGIITFVGGSNYGCLLQNYATVKTLEKFGLNVFTLKTEDQYNYFKPSFKNFKIFLKIILKHGNYVYYYRNILNRKFDKYLNKTKKVYNTSNHLIISNYDYLVFGSDQIWNFSIQNVSKSKDYYLGKFETDSEKIAYSVSVGTDFIPSEYMSDFSSSLNDFKCISVRELKAKELLQPYTYNSISVTIDPTLMLSKEQWMQLEQRPKWFRGNKKYIFTYFLGEISEKVKNFFTDVSDYYGYDFINVSDSWTTRVENSAVEHYIINPQEFVWLIHNSQLVFTDSFHGSIFSIIFRKPLRYFDRMDSNVSMSSRLDSLFNMFDIKEWCIGDVDEKIDNLFYKDYSGVEKVLNNAIMSSNEYLKKGLDISNRI